MANIKYNLVKARVKELINILPKRYGYAAKVVDRLRHKDVDIKISTVYQVVAGNIADETILNEIIAIVEEYKKKQKELASKIEEALNVD